MKNLAPHILRQRLLIEATYEKTISKADVEHYLMQLPSALNLGLYSDPVVYSPGGEGKAENQGYDGFVALIDSGISIYIWETTRFLSVVAYTCKSFDTLIALEFTKNFFKTTELEWMAF
jgi:S-adenosylmethionine/arginine decarboxylase-like enzyme